jgi:hypothetical protein
VKSGSANRGVPGGSKNELPKRNTGEEEGEEKGDGEEEGDDEDGENKDEAEEEEEDRDAAPHGPHCMDPAGPVTKNFCPTSTKRLPPTQPGKQRLKKKAGRKKRENKGGRCESKLKQPRARAKAKNDIETRASGFIAAPRCWAFGVRVRVRKAPL